MMISTKLGFGFVCVPKCASTSVEAYIRKSCNIICSGEPPLKHLSYREYEQGLMPLLAQKGFGDIRMFAVLRQPVDWVRSWYTFRARKVLTDPAHPHHRNYTGDIGFEQFVEAVVSDRPASYARIRSQWHYLQNGAGELGVTTLFAVDNVAEKLPAFMAELGVADPGEMPVRNRSPEGARAPISDDVVRMIETHFARDLELYRRYS